MNDLELCYDDFQYFCEKYLKMKDAPDFVLEDFQKRYIQTLSDHQYVIATKFRNSRLTTLTLAWLTWRLIFRPDEYNVVGAIHREVAGTYGKIVLDWLDNLPDLFDLKFKRKNESQIQYESGFGLTFSDLEPGKGRSIHNLFIDEAAFHKKMDTAWKAYYPTLSAGGRCIVLSTTNGQDNWFHNMYRSAEAGECHFKVFKADCQELPLHRCEDYVKRLKTALGEEGWKQEMMQEFAW